MLKVCLSFIVITIAAVSASGKAEMGLDSPSMMPFFTGEIIPKPQKVTYGQASFSLDNVGIILGENVKQDDPRLKYLLDRIKQYNGNWTFVVSPTNANSVVISVGKTEAGKELDIPPHKEGYAIGVKGNHVALKGNESLGLLWSIMSLNQLIYLKDGKGWVKPATVYDFPYAEKRGMLFTVGGWDCIEDNLKFITTFKLNNVVFHGLIVSPDRRKRKDFRVPIPESVKKKVELIGKTLTPLGITWYAGRRVVSQKFKQLRCDNEEDFNTVYAIIELVCKAGGNVEMNMDDKRFPLAPEDKETFATAAAADVFFIKRIMEKMKKDFPGKRLMFCPPFYFGPASKAAYPEDRDNYLYAIGKLPENLDIFWTGPRVKGTVTTKDDLKWITERLKRKPVIFQNGIGFPHAWRRHYITDPLFNLQKWYYDGYLHDVEVYALNGASPYMASAAASIADWCWDPKGFDPQKSIDIAASTLLGPENLPLVKKINKLMSAFDPYDLRISPGAAKNADTLYKAQKELAECEAELRKRNPKTAQKWTKIFNHINNINRYCEQLKNNPDLNIYAKAAGLSLEQAKKEVKFDPKVDTFLSAYEFIGGKSPRTYRYKSNARHKINVEKRLATWIFGKNSVYNQMGASFNISPYPASKDYKLIISALDDDVADKKCPIEILVNGKKIFEGGAPFDFKNWSLHTFTIPASYLLPENKLIIKATAPTANTSGPPFFMINYAIIRKQAK